MYVFYNLLTIVVGIALYPPFVLNSGNAVLRFGSLYSQFVFVSRGTKKWRSISHLVFTSAVLPVLWGLCCVALVLCPK